jgi:hypothetical protein
MVKFRSEWGKGMQDFTFPDDMPAEIRLRAINRRRQVLIHSYIRNGTGMELISNRLFGQLCKELEDIQAAWGSDFNFYDYLFDGFDEDQEDHLVTNRGCDEFIVKHALGMIAARKAAERKLAY